MRAVLVLMIAMVPAVARALSPEEIFAKVSPSIVVIHASSRSSDEVSTGSGVIVGPGEIVTNCHVVEGADRILALREGTNPVLMREPEMRILLAALFVTVSFAVNAQSVSCQKHGNITYCSDGTTYQRHGNITYGSDGSTYQKHGSITYGSDGRTYQRHGNTTYGSDGTTYQEFGNITYGSDGTTCQRIGNQIYCSK